MDKDWIFKTDEYICDLRTVGVLVRDGKLLVQRDQDGSEFVSHKDNCNVVLGWIPIEKLA